MIRWLWSAHRLRILAGPDQISPLLIKMVIDIGSPKTCIIFELNFECYMVKRSLFLVSWLRQSTRFDRGFCTDRGLKSSVFILVLGIIA